MILNSHTCRKKERKKERKNIYKEKGLEVEREGSAMGQKLITPGKKHIKRFDSEMLVATCLRTIVKHWLQAPAKLWCVFRLFTPTPFSSCGGGEFVTDSCGQLAAG